jgi:hypothetical protein
MLCAVIFASWFFGLNNTLLTVGAVVFLAVVLCLIAWDAWRAYTPRGFALYLLMWCCIAFAGICEIHSTWPSSAPRRQAEGIITWIVIPREVRKTYTLGLALPSGAVLPFRASAIPPFFAKGRDLVSVSYLDEKVIGNYQRAIGFRVLNGPRAGYQDSVNADWLGPWLGVLFGPLCGVAALWGAYSNKRSKPEPLR